MWRLNKNRATSPAGNELIDRLAIIISRFLIKLQCAFAASLSKMTKPFPNNAVRWIIVAFGLGWFILSLYFISKTFTVEDEQRNIFISHLRQPTLSNSRFPHNNTATVIITELEYNKMVQFQAYMDSLAKYANIYDSIIIARPGLMDSVLALKETYSQQKK